MREQDRGKIKTPFMLAFSVGAVLFSAHAGGGKAIDTCKVLAHSTNRPFFTFPTIQKTVSFPVCYFCRDCLFLLISLAICLILC